MQDLTQIKKRCIWTSEWLWDYDHRLDTAKDQNTLWWRNIKINRMEKITFTQNVDIFKKLLRCNALFYDLRKLINDFRKLIYVQRKLIYENR